MEMPCLCDVCGEWFDLNDGRSHPNKSIVVCRSCSEKLQSEQDIIDEIEQLENDLADRAEYTVGNRRMYNQELKELRSKLEKLQNE